MRRTGRSSDSHRAVLVAMTLANAMILVDQTAIPLILPAVNKQFHVTSDASQWVLNASLLPLASLLVLGGRLGDLLGRRRAFVAGALAFTGASVVGGLTPVFPLLLVARVAQGTGAALMLPGSVAIVSSTVPEVERGRSLGLMGGVAAIAGALGPTVGGGLTAAVSWRLVLLVNVPLAIACVVATLRAVPRDGPRNARNTIDLGGAALLAAAIAGVVFGLSRTQYGPVLAATVVVPIAVGLVALLLFLHHERRTVDPLMNLSLLRRTPNYLGASIGQGLTGMAEMGLGVLFPLLLILNMGMSPAVAGLALIPTTLPMVLIAPLTGRWYDRVGGRPPLVAGFIVATVAGVALALSTGFASYGWGAIGQYLALLPGLVLYGAGLAMILAANDPVSLDSVPLAAHGQASGVAATAEQAGGAVGIAALFAIFHGAYVGRLNGLVASDRLPALHTSNPLRSALQQAEETGLNPHHFNETLVKYLPAAFSASEHGYVVAFCAFAVLMAVGLVTTLRTIRRPRPVSTSPPAGLQSEG